MVRIAESLAKMRLSPTVEQQDVAEALRLMKVTQQPFESNTLLMIFLASCSNVYDALIAESYTLL